jgi:hypothetical protein
VPSCEPPNGCVERLVGSLWFVGECRRESFEGGLTVADKGASLPGRAEERDGL